MAKILRSTDPTQEGTSPKVQFVLNARPLQDRTNKHDASLARCFAYLALSRLIFSFLFFIAIKSSSAVFFRLVINSTASIDGSDWLTARTEGKQPHTNFVVSNKSETKKIFACRIRAALDPASCFNFLLSFINFNY